MDRTGAVGKLKSVYIRDPDQNLVEYEHTVLVSAPLTAAQDLKLRLMAWRNTQLILEAYM